MIGISSHHAGFYIDLAQLRWKSTYSGKPFSRSVGWRVEYYIDNWGYIYGLQNRFFEHAYRDLLQYFGRV